MFLDTSTAPVLLMVLFLFVIAFSIATDFELPRRLTRMGAGRGTTTGQTINPTTPLLGPFTRVNAEGETETFHYGTLD